MQISSHIQWKESIQHSYQPPIVLHKQTHQALEYSIMCLCIIDHEVLQIRQIMENKKKMNVY